MRIATAVPMLSASLSVLAIFVAGLTHVSAQGVGPVAKAPPAKIESVVELFTSQGCSSCPSADALLVKYTNKPGVLALSYSVDYWDYLGWRDTLASPKYTQRQKQYAKLRGDGQVYTPQAIVDGRDHVVGSSASGIDGLLVQAAKSTGRPWLAAEATPTLVTVAAPIAGATRAKPATVWVVTYAPRVEVAIRRGENAGQTITYHNVVRDIAVLAEWDTKSDFRRALSSDAANAPKPGERQAILVQDSETGRLLGAAHVN